MSEEDNLIQVNFTGTNRGRVSSANDAPLRRQYGVLLLRQADQAIGIGNVIITKDIEAWGAENGFDILRSFRFNRTPPSSRNTKIKFVK